MAGRHGSRTLGQWRLPGSVAEVQASPPGPEIGAFVNLDGILVAGFTGVLTQGTFRRREIGIGEFLGVVQSALNHQLGPADFEDLVHKCLMSAVSR
jgi:putative phosphoserine phosphatase/1-acylglycerol-3-phosphate O-acyltransferase